jgi:adenylosuccinate lyase/3-carboxy-cis,cis-muconate cycloisomerase
MGTIHDHELLGNLFGTAEMRKLFDGDATLRAWLEVERALAEAEADVGEIPAVAAKRIAKEARADRFDMSDLAQKILITGHPLVPLIRELIKRCGSHGAYVHWGATTQDIVDTGMMLQCRAGLALLEVSVSGAIQGLLTHAKRFQATPMAGRTHQQHASPITFGFKVAIWADELMRAYDRLQSAQESLTGQFAGAVGTLASLPVRGAAIREGLCRRLGLKATAVPWHASRDRVREIAMALSELSIAAERIGFEVAHLQSTELAEASEPISAHHVGSSTMPQKRNPHASELMVAGARLLRGATTCLSSYGVHADERDLSSWAIEWIALPQAFILASGVGKHLVHVAQGLTTNVDRMAANLQLTNGQIMAESVMMQLARHVGHEPAHEIVAAAAREASVRRKDLATALLGDSRVTAGSVKVLSNPPHTEPLPGRLRGRRQIRPCCGEETGPRADRGQKTINNGPAAGAIVAGR